VLDAGSAHCCTFEIRVHIPVQCSHIFHRANACSNDNRKSRHEVRVDDLTHQTLCATYGPDQSVAMHINLSVFAGSREWQGRSQALQASALERWAQLRAARVWVTPPTSTCTVDAKTRQSSLRTYVVTCGTDSSPACDHMHVQFCQRRWKVPVHGMPAEHELQPKAGL
jgi:hypothetical protein